MGHAQRLRLLQRLRAAAPAQWHHFLDDAVASVDEGRPMSSHALSELADFTAFAQGACGVNLPDPGNAPQ
jgi:hypothetical protein